MKSENEQAIDQLLEDKVSHEKRIRQRSFLLLTFFVIAGVLWLGFTLWQVEKKNQKIEKLNLQIQTLNDFISLKQDHILELEEDLQTIKIDLAEVNRKLHEADNFKLQKVDIRAEDKKGFLYSNDFSPKLQNTFKQILDFQNQTIRFSVQGNNPQTGFNSPSFISYVLKQEGLINKVYLNARSLIEKFTNVNGEFKNGDIIVYESGYCMIYFSSRMTNSNFVFGMTPSGVLALKPGFAKKVAHLRPNYMN